VVSGQEVFGHKCESERPVWASIPVSAAWLLGVLLGIELICEGAAITHLAWQVQKKPRWGGA